MRLVAFVNRKRSSLPLPLHLLPGPGLRQARSRLIFGAASSCLIPAPAPELRQTKRPPRAIASGWSPVLFCGCCADSCVHALPVFVPVPCHAMPCSAHHRHGGLHLRHSGPPMTIFALRSRCILLCRLLTGLLRPVCCRSSPLVARDRTHMAPSGYPDTPKAMYALSIIIIVATRERRGRPTPAPSHAMTPYGVIGRAKAKDKAKGKGKAKGKPRSRPPERG